jgi:hypothetical protein
VGGPVSVQRLRSIHIIRHDTTRHDKIFLYGFDMLEFTVSGHRQVTTKTDELSFGLDEIILSLPVDVFCRVVSCRVVPCRIM